MQGEDEREVCRSRDAGDGQDVVEGSGIPEGPDAAEGNEPVRARAALIDPASMTVVWVNESAAQVLEDRVSGPVAGMAIDQLVPIYRLPDGMLLLLSEHAWHMERPAEGAGAPRRGRGAARGKGAAGGSGRAGR